MIKSLKEMYENTNMHWKEMNKTIQDLKMDLEVIRKIQTETFLEMENLAKHKGTIDSSITNRLQETEENISGEEETDTSFKKKVYS